MLPADSEIGAQLAQALIRQYHSSDPLTLAKLAGVTVHHQAWHPCTWGEFDARTGCICLNLNAPIPLSMVLAHELGHYFLHAQGWVGSRQEEEVQAEAFAATLLAQHSAKPVLNNAQNPLSLTVLKLEKP